MKLSIAWSMVWLSLLIGLSLCVHASENEVVKGSSHDLLLVLLEQGHIRIVRYPFRADSRDSQILFSLDLSDKNESYTTIVCNDLISGLVVIRSNNEAMCDYCLNWGAMVGVDIVQSQVAKCAPVKIRVDEQGEQSVLISSVVDNKNVDLEIALDRSVKSVAAIIVPTSLVQEIKASNEIMPFAEGCRLGIIVAKGRNYIVQDPSIEQEIEFERIIDAMVQDGTIKVRQVSPFMAQLRTIGSTIFVKYLAVKNAIRSWWYKSSEQSQASSIMSKKLYNQIK